MRELNSFTTFAARSICSVVCRPRRGITLLSANLDRVSQKLAWAEQATPRRADWAALPLSFDADLKRPLCTLGRSRKWRSAANNLQCGLVQTRRPGASHDGNAAEAAAGRDYETNDDRAARAHAWFCDTV